MNLTDRPDMTMFVYHAVAVMQEINQRNKHYKYNTTKSVLYMSHCDNFSPINKSSLEKSLSEKYVHIPGCQKMRPFTQKSRKLGSFIYFLLKKGGQSYTWQSCKRRGWGRRAAFGTHIRIMPYIGSNRTPLPHNRSLGPI